MGRWVGTVNKLWLVRTQVQDGYQLDLAGCRIKEQSRAKFLRAKMHEKAVEVFRYLGYRSPS